MLKGMKERLEIELKKKVATNMKVKVIASPEREYSTWLGGSIIGRSFGTLSSES